MELLTCAVADMFQLTDARKQTPAGCDPPRPPIGHRPPAFASPLAEVYLHSVVQRKLHQYEERVRLLMEVAEAEQEQLKQNQQRYDAPPPAVDTFPTTSAYYREAAYVPPHAAMDDAHCGAAPLTVVNRPTPSPDDYEAARPPTAPAAASAAAQQVPSHFSPPAPSPATTTATAEGGGNWYDRDNAQKPSQHHSSPSSPAEVDTSKPAATAAHASFGAAAPSPSAAAAAAVDDSASFEPLRAEATDTSDAYAAEVPSPPQKENATGAGPSGVDFESINATPSGGGSAVRGDGGAIGHVTTVVPNPGVFDSPPPLSSSPRQARDTEATTVPEASVLRRFKTEGDAGDEAFDSIFSSFLAKGAGEADQ